MFDATLQLLARDFRGGLRSLIKRPFVSVAAIFSLALAIGGNAVIFSMVSAWLMYSWDYRDPDTIAFVWQNKGGGALGQTPVSPANFADWRERSQTLEHWSGLRAVPMTLLAGEVPESITGAETSADIFPLLGFTAAQGRAFTAQDEVPGRDRVVILSHDFWVKRFGGEAGLLDTDLQLNGEAYRVVGILPKDFEFIFAPADVYVPLALPASDLPRGRLELLVMARVRGGFTVQQAQEEMKNIAKELEAEYPVENKGYSASLLSLPDQFPGELNERLFTLLQGLLLLVLLIACINVANLLLAQGQQRHKEIALRTALGAGRGSIVRQLLAESLVLALVGGLVGLSLGYVGIKASVAALGSLLPPSLTPSIDWRVLLFTLGITVFAGLLFGLTPALQASKPNLSLALGEGGRGEAGSRRRRWISRGLVVAEIAGALIMLSGAGLLLRSFLDFQNADAGFEEKNLLTFQVTLGEADFAADSQVSEAYERLAESFSQLPGVTFATLTTALPRTPMSPSAPFTIEGRAEAADGADHSAKFVAVSEEYTQTLGIPLLRGRPLSSADRADSLPVALINRSMAERYWPEADPLGARVTLNGTTREIVGVIGDVQQDLFQGTAKGFPPVLYLPLGQMSSRTQSALLRTSVPPKTVIPAVREALRKLDPDLVPAQVRTMEEHVAQFFVGMNLINNLLIVFGLVALVLAAVGIYGVIAFSVAQRTKEIGIRMAVGASRRNVLRQVTWEGIVLALLGFALGFPGVLLMIQGLKSVLQGLSGVTPATAGLVAVLLFAVALIASLIPAKRAADLDPLEALRRE
jgi:putative ABC transport system permease protein